MQKRAVLLHSPLRGRHLSPFGERSFRLTNPPFGCIHIPKYMPTRSVCNGILCPSIVYAQPEHIIRYFFTALNRKDKI